MLELIRLEDEIDRRLGEVLLRMDRAHAWDTLGFAGLGQYAEERLGMARTTAEDRVGLARSLEDLPALRDAYQRGRVSVKAALLVRRAVRAEPVGHRREREWVRHAEQVTVKRLRDDLRTTGYRRAVGDEVREGPPSDQEWFEGRYRKVGTARERLERLAARCAARPVTAVLLRVRLPEDVAGDLLAAIGAERARLEALISSRGHLQYSDARFVWVWDGPGAPEALVAGNVSPWAMRSACACIERSFRVPSWVGFLSLLEQFIETWDVRDHSVRRRNGEAVFERAGYGCQAPGCTSRDKLQLHHLTFRSHGGSDDPSNLIALCECDHQGGIHGGLARCWGKAPLDVTWEMGLAECASWYRNERRISAPSDVNEV